MTSRQVRCKWCGPQLVPVETITILGNPDDGNLRAVVYCPTCEGTRTFRWGIKGMAALMRQGALALPMIVEEDVDDLLARMSDPDLFVAAVAAVTKEYQA